MMIVKGRGYTFAPKITSFIHMAEDGRTKSTMMTSRGF